MGQSSSTEEVPSELREVQSLAASTGALPSLEKAFSLLSDPHTKSIPVDSLQKCFDVRFENLESAQATVLKEFPGFFTHLGSAIVDLFFVTGKNGVNLIEFLRGFNKICARSAASASLNNLFRVFHTACSKAEISLDLNFELYDDDCKIIGSFYPRDVAMLLGVCWILSWDSRKLKSNSKMECGLPDVCPLVASAADFCVEYCSKLDLWDSAVLEMDIKLPASEIHMWALKTVPNLADCFQQFVNSRIVYLAAHEEKMVPTCSLAQASSSAETSVTAILTPGRAWAISLSLRGPISEEMSKACFPCDFEETDDNLIYRSTVHGKGLNRFWSNVEGYNGPLLVLISVCDNNTSARRWVIGALTNQGFESKESFYGSSGSLYALAPVFQPLHSSGKEKNFVYSHLHPTGRVYEPNPKPVGIAFGGSIGNERIYIDEDFSKVTVRHHAVDRTYQHGSLFPGQGFLPVEASILEVEVLGLGGKSCLKIQNAYQKREQLFTEQRRKVDLKSFANWEDSPEKMMMDMMSNPNAVKREDR